MAEPAEKHRRPARTRTIRPRAPALPRDPLAAAVVSVTPILLESRYRLLVGAYARLRRSRRGRWAVGAGTGALTLGLGALAVRHFAAMSWPLSSRHPMVLAAAAVLLVLAQVLKAFGWGRLFALAERPPLLALAAGNGGAALAGVLLPGRFDDAMRIAVVRRYPRCPAGIRVLCLSLVMLGLIDCVALVPLALTGAVLPGAGTGMRIGLAIVAAAGIAAATVIAVLPRVATSRRTLRFRLGRWVSTRTTSPQRASEAWALVSACWFVRAAASFLLLGALGAGYSIPLALLFLCAGAAAAALPVGLAGAATQAGAGGAALAATGIGAPEALHVALSGGVLGVLTGTAVFVAAIVWRSGASLVERSAAPGSTSATP
jgi:hypothetical protein